MNRVRVLVVDDSPTMRGLISATLRRDPGIEVIGGAGDPIEAREAIKALSPDVITLDVEMPRMDGIEFLEKVMRLRPMPVIMVSTLTQAGAAVSLEALVLGAVDCVAKPHFEDLAAKVKSAANASVRAIGERPGASAPRSDYRPGAKTIAIGSSTGGVEALLTMLSSFPRNCPPTLITQHMPATFTASFAERLNRSIEPAVKEAADGDLIQVGHVYLAPGGARHLEVQGGVQPRCRLVDGPTVNGHRPSIDVLFNSVQRTFGSRAAGVILTGMGRDGAAGLKAMRDAGARTLGQDAASSVVYGMPKAAFEMGAVEAQVSLSRIGPAVLDICSMQAGKAI